VSTSSDDLRAIALAEFASAGYGATSLQRIADLAGLSKSSVLYHYSSKETLLEAAVAPAIDRMEGMLDRLVMAPLTAEARLHFIEDFVDFLLAYRHEVYTFINQGSSLVDVPVIDRANEVVRRLAAFFADNSGSPEETMRFGIALGGAAYMLCTKDTLGIGTDAWAVDETRTGLVTIITELLVPAPHRPAAATKE
jgi:AcrR family transcriptional regulator